MLWQVAILFGGWTVFGPDTNELGGLDATQGVIRLAAVSLRPIGEFVSGLRQVSVEFCHVLYIERWLFANAHNRFNTHQTHEFSSKFRSQSRFPPHRYRPRIVLYLIID